MREGEIKGSLQDDDKTQVRTLVYVAVTAGGRRGEDSLAVKYKALSVNLTGGQDNAPSRLRVRSL